MHTIKFPFLYASLLYFVNSLLYGVLAVLEANGKKDRVTLFVTASFCLFHLTFGLILFTKEAVISAPVWNALSAMAHIVMAWIGLKSIAVVLAFSGLANIFLGGENQMAPEVHGAFFDIYASFAAFVAGVNACVIFILMIKTRVRFFKKLWFVPGILYVIYAILRTAVAVSGFTYFSVTFACIAAITTVAVFITGKQIAVGSLTNS